MKSRVVMMLALAASVYGATDAAAGCKPDFLQRDKITRAEVAN